MVRYFYNTTKEHNATLDNFTLIAEHQEKLLLDFIRENPDKIFSSEDIAFLFPINTPITSIRRAVCNLKNKGFLVTIGKKKGEFNRPIFLYQPKEDIKWQKIID